MNTNNSATENNFNTNMQIKAIVSDINKYKESIVDTDFNTNIKKLNGKEKAELDRYKSDTILKKYLSVFVVSFTSIWSISILVFLFLTGFGKITVSDKILITILTETLITVLGLPSIVTYHFFPRQR